MFDKKCSNANQQSSIIISLVWFYGISIIVGYLMPNPVKYKLNMICECILQIHS